MKKNHGKQTKVLLQLIKTVSLGMNKVVHKIIKTVQKSIRATEGRKKTKGQQIFYIKVAN